IEAVVSALNDLVSRLTSTLDNERLFTADVAHELRTPLAGVRLHLELLAIDDQGHEVYGEVNIDQLTTPIQELLLTPNVPATREAVHAISEADLIIIGPGSFYTSLMPILLLKEIAQALRRTPAPMVYIGNLGRELSLPAANLKLESKLAIMEQYVGKKVIDAVIVGPKVDVSAVKERIVIQEVLEASDIPYRHDRQLLHNALEKALQALG
ncbi:2-phospho-L-lactate transferase CofD family protein, partial [Escherichia coli]|nr:2-phospho-L-lactate transferase CofD family protein [Escherichia coli]